MAAVSERLLDPVLKVILYYRLQKGLQSMLW